MAYFIQADGGRRAAGLPCGLNYTEGDCVVRAICNVVGHPEAYSEVRQVCMDINASAKPEWLPLSHARLAGKRSIQDGVLVNTPMFVRLMDECGFGPCQEYYSWLQACTLPSLDQWSAAHPTGRWLVALNDHMTAWVGGCWVDWFDPQTYPEARHGVYAAWEYKGA